MSIAPPSDIILDVAQAADPQRLQAATTKLNAMATASGGTAVDFQSLLANAAAKPSPAATAAASPAGAPPTPFPSRAATVTPPMSPYRKFEAVLLQTFVQEMLPKDDNLFGDAASADACRSMLAEQLANQLAKSGRIGIAQMIEKAHGPQAAAAKPRDGRPGGTRAWMSRGRRPPAPSQPGPASSREFRAAPAMTSETRTHR